MILKVLALVLQFRVKLILAVRAKTGRVKVELLIPGPEFTAHPAKALFFTMLGAIPIIDILSFGFVVSVIQEVALHGFSGAAGVFADMLFVESEPERFKMLIHRYLITSSRNLMYCCNSFLPQTGEEGLTTAWYLSMMHEYGPTWISAISLFL